MVRGHTNIKQPGEGIPRDGGMETLKIDGKDYNFNAEGYCTNP